MEGGGKQHMTVHVVVAHTDASARDELASPLREGGYVLAEAADFDAALAACQALEPDVALDSDEGGAATVAEDLRASVEDLQARCGAHLLRATISVGWATWDGEEDADRLIKRADLALFEAKDSGRNTVRAAESGSASLRRRT